MAIFPVGLLSLLKGITIAAGLSSMGVFVLTAPVLAAETSKVGKTEASKTESSKTSSPKSTGTLLSPFEFIEGSSSLALKRVSEHPVLSPRAAGHFDSAGAYNPAAVKVGDKYVLFYRGQDTNGTSFVGFAESTDGLHFEASPEPLLKPDTDYERDGGLEDPRLQKIGKTFYLTYTAYNKKDAQLCLATSMDLKNWVRHGVILPAYQGNWNTGWTKSGAIVPEKVNGKYWMYFLGTADGTDQMGIAQSDDLLHWTDASTQPVLAKRAGAFDSRVVEPGPPPIITDDGILLIYNGADDKLVYKVGWVLFDKHDPAKVIARCEEPIFQPERDWELKGQVPNVVFVEGLIKEGNSLLLYFGGADKFTGVARAQLRVPTKRDRKGSL